MRVYAIPNFECNLSCPHCELSYKHIAFNQKAFLSELQTFSDTDIITLFGGEPLLYSDRFEACLSTGKVSSVSTNLLCNITKLILQIKIHPKTSIATSWNKTRFTDVLLQQWLENLKMLNAVTHDVMVMITMTEDLVNSSIDSFLDVLDMIEKTGSVSKVLFEHYIGSYANEEHNLHCDEWLCEIHKSWRFNMSNELEKKLPDWRHDCSDTYTLLPNGKQQHGCPLSQDLCFTVQTQCLTCKEAAHCQPCILQLSCTFPAKLNTLLETEKMLKLG